MRTDARPAAQAPDDRDLPGEAPLSIAQQGAVASHTQAPGSAVMTIGIVAEIRPCVDVPLFREAVRRTAEELDGMRVQLVERPEGWRQHVDPDVDLDLVVHDVSDRPDPAAAAAQLVDELSRTRLPFGEHVALLQNHLVVEAPDRCHWLLIGHHAVSDGYSGMLIRGRVAAWYDHLRGEGPQPAPPGAGVADAWAVADGGRDDSTVDRWGQYLDGLPDRLTLAPREGDLNAPTTRTRVVVDGRDVARLTEAGGLGSWVFPAFAVGVAYTARVLARDEVVFGFVVAGRSQKVERQVVSSHARVVPLRVPVPADATLEALARTVRADATRVQRLGPTTAEELRGRLPLAWRLGRVHGPILNVIPFDTEIEMSGHQLYSQACNRGPAEDLQVTIIPRGDGIELDTVSNDHAYEPAHARRHVERMARLFHLAAQEPGTPLLDLDPSLPEEVALREAHERGAGVRLVDEAGRPALLGEVAVVASADGSDTGRRGRLHLDGSYEDLGTAQDVAVLGGHVVALAPVRRAVEALPGVARCEPSIAKRRVHVGVVPTPDADVVALERDAKAAVKAVVPALVGARVTVTGP